MQDDYNDPSGNRMYRDGNDAYSSDTDGEFDDYEDDEDYETYDDSDLDKELSGEHNFRIAMNVFDLISMLVGLAVILLIAGLLFSLFNWVQRDIAQSLSVLTSPFR